MKTIDRCELVAVTGGSLDTRPPGGPRPEPLPLPQLPRPETIPLGPFYPTPTQPTIA